MTERNWNNYEEFSEYWYQTKQSELNPPKVIERFRNDLPPLLGSNIMLISFKKVNSDSVRCMKCTLLPDYLPEFDKEKSEVNEKSEAYTVWDLEANGWRSFRFDSLLDYEIEEKLCT